MADKKQISKDMLIGDIIKKYPVAIEIMLEHGIHCVGCHVATWETLEQGAQAHGVDIHKLTTSINDKISSK